MKKSDYEELRMSMSIANTIGGRTNTAVLTPGKSGDAITLYPHPITFLLSKNLTQILKT